MSRIGFTNSRTTSLQLSDRLLSSLRKTQKGLFDTQTAISTGKQVNKPSDSPGDSSAILLLYSALAAREQHAKNLNFAGGLLDNADQALKDATDLLLESKSIGQSQIGVGSDADTRRNQATVLEAQINSLLEIANRQSEGVSIFGGRVTTGKGAAGQPVFVEKLGGIRYVGSRQNQGVDVGFAEPLALNSNGQDAFSALSDRVLSGVDLNPNATASTSLSDLEGAQGKGIRKGTILVTVNGLSVTADLTDADTLGDVETRVNAAIDSLTLGAGSLAASGNGLSLNVAAGNSITISDVGSSPTAADLGISVGPIGGPAVQAGGDVGPRLTTLTALASLGAGVDFTSGLKVTQGATTQVIDFSTATTVQDLINIVEQSDLGLRMEVNEAGTGLNLVSEISGINLSIGEVSGGTTATDLGLRSFDLNTNLTDLNHGLGVGRSNQASQPDFAIDLHDGSQFSVSLNGVATIGDLLTAIQSAAETALGVANVGTLGQAGTQFNLGLAADGNGLVFEDGTAGGNDFKVTQLNTSLAATDLGIYQNVSTGSSITSADVAMIRTDNSFTHLMALRDALASNDERGIELATSDLEKDLTNVLRARADVGVRAKQVEQYKDRSEVLKTNDKVLLSNLEDADLSQVLIRFSQLQQQLEASLSVGAQNLQLSLLDFLR